MKIPIFLALFLLSPLLAGAPPCTDLTCDKSVVRSILDANDQNNTEVDRVIGVLKSRVVYLRFFQGTITFLPADINRLSELAILDVRDNKLTSLPPQIGDLPDLHSLIFVNNQLEYLPSEIGNLSKLEFLRLEKNKLTNLPSELGKLSRLSMLYLDSNKLTNLPSEIGNLSSLKFLHLSDNLLTSLPVTITDLKPAIAEPVAGLYVQGNCLSDVPGSISSWIDIYNRSFVKNENGVYDNSWKESQFCGTMSARVPLYQGSNCKTNP